jgi:hypothetical protein
LDGSGLAVVTGDVGLVGPIVLGGKVPVGDVVLTGKVTVIAPPDEPETGCEGLVTVVTDDLETARQVLATETGTTEPAAGSS